MENCSKVLHHFREARQQLGQEIKKISLLSPRKSPSYSSPREDISSMWRDLHGSRDWAWLLDPLHPCLRREIIKYGEFAQATYDAFNATGVSRNCLFAPASLFNQLGLSNSGYAVTCYLYAMSRIQLPGSAESLLHVEKQCMKSNWMGFVAVSDDGETRRIGRRDIVVAWRGTVTKAEWYENVQVKMKPPCWGKIEDDAKVEAGFHGIYTSKDSSTEYTKRSASEQAMAEIRRLVKIYADRGEVVSLTITGHSLGGALALLNAHEAAAASIDGLDCVSVISFAAPRVGNAAFGRDLEERGAKALRLVIRQDFVPELPGVVLTEKLDKAVALVHRNSAYVHAGRELVLNVRNSPYLKHGTKHILGNHSMETYLHLIDGFTGQTDGFRIEARRKVSLVNKYSGLLKKELGVPAGWYQKRGQ